MVAEPSRRTMLMAAGTAALAAGSVGLAGCKGIAALGPVPGLPADVVTLDHAIAGERAIVASYAAALSKLTTIAGQGAGSVLLRTVAGIHAEHEAHLRQLRERLVLPARLAGSKVGQGRPPSPAMPDSETGLLVALAAAESAAAARLTRQLVDVPPPLAQLMASIAASEAAHVVFLRRAGRT